MLVGSNCDLENTKGVLLHGMRVAVPTVYSALARSGAGWLSKGCTALTEVADEERLFGVGSPLPIHNIVILINVETELLSSLEWCGQSGCLPSRVPRALYLEAACLGELGQTTFCLVDLLDPVPGSGDSSLQHVLEGREPGVNLQDTWGQGQLYTRSRRVSVPT